MTDEYIDLSVCTNWLVVIHIAFNIYTKVKCLILRVGHTHAIYHFKALNFLYLMIQCRIPPDLYQMRSKSKTYFFTFIF